MVILLFTLTMIEPCLSEANSLSLPQQFKFFEVTIEVKDRTGMPIRDAWVKAFSEDWGIMYPQFEEWGETDSSGIYKFHIVGGNWTFIISSGWHYIDLNPNNGIFIAVTRYVDKDLLLTLRPEKKMTIKIIDESGSPIEVDELYAFLSRRVPAIPPAIVGRSTSGYFTLSVGGDLEGGLTILALKRSKTGNNYLLVEKVSLNGTTIISTQNSAEISFEAYNPDHTPSNQWDVEFRLPDLYLGNWAYLFRVYGKTIVKASPMKVVLNPRYMPPGWYYYFEHIALTLKEDTTYSYRFGGKAYFNLWVIKEDTQLWFDVRDEFGNVLAFYSGPDSSHYVRLRIFEDGSKVYDDNIGKYISGTLFYAIGKTFSDNASFLLEIDLGPLGELGSLTVEDTLYNEEVLCKFRDIKTENFNLHVPQERFWIISGQRRDEVFIDNLEAIYTFIGNFTGEVLEGKPHKCEVKFVPAGVAGTNFVGYGLGVARWAVHVNPGQLNVLSHELGHLYSFTPPLMYGVECPWFCEPLATYLGIEGIAKIYGDNVRLWYWGTHPKFFDYLEGTQKFDPVENMQFLFFYIHRIYGPNVHKEFFRNWNLLKSKLNFYDYTNLETTVILYSLIVQENLSWLFELAGFDVDEDRISRGIEIARTPSSISCQAPLIVKLNDNVTIWGQIDPPHEARVNLLFISPDGREEVHTTSSNASGFYEYIFTPNKEGVWKLYASWPGDWDHKGAISKEVSFEVRPRHMITTKTVTVTRSEAITRTVTAPMTITRTKTVTSIVTQTVTAEKVIEREVLPGIPFLAAIVVAATIIALAIIITRWGSRRPTTFKDAEKLHEKIKRLKELHERGEIGDVAYYRLLREYLEKFGYEEEGAETRREGRSETDPSGEGEI